MRSNRRIVKRFPLVESIPYGAAEGGQLEELIFYKPRGKTLRRISQTKESGDQAMVIVHDLTEIPIEVLDCIDLEDAILASAIAGDLVEKKFDAAARRGREIGVQLPTAEEAGLSKGNLADATTSPEELEEIADPENLESV